MFLSVEVVFTYILHAFDHEMFSPLLCCRLGVLLGAPWAIQILSEMQKIKQKSHLGEAWRPKSVLVRFKVRLTHRVGTAECAERLNPPHPPWWMAGV